MSLIDQSQVVNNQNNVNLNHIDYSLLNWIVKLELTGSIKFKVFYEKEFELLVYIDKNTLNNQDIAFFGFWDYSSSNDDIQNSLFLQMHDWVKKLKVERIIGPLCFSTFFDYRLKINNFNKKQFLGEPLNSEYHVKFLLKLGYKIDTLYYTYHIDSLLELYQEMSKLLSDKVCSNIQGKLLFKSLTAQNINLYSEKIRVVIDEIFQDNLYYKELNPLTYFNIIEKEIRESICDKTSYLLVCKESDEIAGIGICMKGEENTLLIKTLGIRKKYRKMGLLFLILAQKIISSALVKYKMGKLCLMKESNFPQIIGKDKACDITEYALFSKNISYE